MNEVKPIIIDDNELSLSMYMDEYPETFDTGDIIQKQPTKTNWVLIIILIMLAGIWGYVFFK
jgi:hypothetical protein